MAKHEFGIMEEAPKSGVRYDSYEPEKYRCISVDDDYIEQIDAKCTFDSFCHTIDIPYKGLNYCGITLIPPKSCGEFAKLIKDIRDLQPLYFLLLRAEKDQKYMIHYGL